MKKVTILAMLTVGIAAGTVVWAGHHETRKQAAWFDSEVCEICKPMSVHTELMTSMKWETHTIKDGMLMVAMIPEKHRTKFERLCAKMHKKGEQIAASGKSVDLCGFCDSFGKLKQAGAKEEMVKTAFGRITLITAQDAATVKKIHKHAKRTQDEAKKMAAAMN